MSEPHDHDIARLRGQLLQTADGRAMLKAIHGKRGFNLPPSLEVAETVKTLYVRALKEAVAALPIKPRVQR